MVDSVSAARQKFVDNVASQDALQRFQREATTEAFVEGLNRLEGLNASQNGPVAQRFSDGVDRIDTTSDLQGDLSDNQIGSKWEQNFTDAINNGQFQSPPPEER
jgi:hypothetical protein